MASTSLSEPSSALDGSRDLESYQTAEQTLFFDPAASSESMVEGTEQAELYHARVVWRDPKLNERDQKNEQKWVLKVFKKGTLLWNLQLQWPQGLLEFDAERMQLTKLGKPQPLMYACDVHNGTLLKDGRFAFLLTREQGDLRTFIDDNMKMNYRPFEKEFAEFIMYSVGLSVNWLHSRNIVHRDLKASNVLYTFRERSWEFYVADFECSVGVVGTGFFRAPEILQALRDKSISQKPELFSREADVYAYGMTCYEILTGKLPFGKHKQNDYDLVLNGQRPEVPEYVDDWACELLHKCWQSNPSVSVFGYWCVKIVFVQNMSCMYHGDLNFIRDVRNQPHKRINQSASSSYPQQAVRYSYDSQLD